MFAYILCKLGRARRAAAQSFSSRGRRRERRPGWLRSGSGPHPETAVKTGCGTRSLSRRGSATATVIPRLFGYGAKMDPLLLNALTRQHEVHMCHRPYRPRIDLAIART
jgi:hypothetical protein